MNNVQYSNSCACPIFLSSDSLNSGEVNLERSPKIAVQMHIYFIELLEELVDSINNIPVPFDCFITTDTVEKQKVICNYVALKCKAVSSVVDIVPNRGRDIAPFLLQMKSCIHKYDYICHIHGKKSETVQFGDQWRKFLIRHLLGTREYVALLLSVLENNKNIGIVYPSTYPVIIRGATWGGAREDVATLLSSMGLRCSLPEVEPIFPAGNMFWARVEAVAPLFDLDLSIADFPDEQGQTNYTLAHVIERCWSYLVGAQGYTTKQFMNGFADCEPENQKRLALFVHYDADNRVSEEDIFYLSELVKVTSEVAFITNSALSDSELDKVRPYASEVIVRDNLGYDFGAWHDYFVSIDRERLLLFDEVVLCNNSCVGPINGFSQMFSQMSKDPADFWGLTLYPYHSDIVCLNPDDDGTGYIPEHLQSYFIVLRNPVLVSNSFWAFWNQYSMTDDYLSTVLHGELIFTEMLSQAGLSYAAYLPESLDIGSWYETEQPQNELGYEYVLLGSPLIKKKCDVFLSDYKRRCLLDLLHELNADRSIIDFFEKDKPLIARNEVIESALKMADSIQDHLRIGKLGPQEPPIETFYWYIMEDAVYPFSKEEYERSRSSKDYIINWIVPPMGVGSGGHVTLFRFMSGLEKRGFHSRIYIYGDHLFETDEQFKQFLMKHYEILDHRIEAFCDTSKISFSHIAIATEWKTAYFLRRFDNTISKYYFIQDYEPLFYPHGSEYQLAENTYGFGFRAITAGNWLKDVMRKKFNVEAVSFSFSASQDIYYPRPRTKQGKRLFFYARPVTPRRDFELGLLALNQVCKLMPDVTIEFAGWDVSKYVIPFNHVNHGIVSSEDLACLYSECDMCLVLSGTNLSLVPLEVMACGSIAICSDGANSTWLVDEHNGIIVSENPREIADAIVSYYNDPIRMEKTRARGIKFVNSTSWEKEIEKVNQALKSGFAQDASNLMIEQNAS